MVDSLGERLKKYESAYDQIMIGKLPVIIRLDGKGFFKWTRKILDMKKE